MFFVGKTTSRIESGACGKCSWKGWKDYVAETDVVDTVACLPPPSIALLQYLILLSSKSTSRRILPCSLSNLSFASLTPSSSFFFAYAESDDG